MTSQQGQSHTQPCWQLFSLRHRHFQSLNQNNVRYNPVIAFTPKFLVASYSVCMQLEDDTLLLWLQGCVYIELRLRLAANRNQMLQHVSRTAQSFVLLLRTRDKLLKVGEICVRQKVQPYVREEMNNKYWHGGKRKSQLQEQNLHLAMLSNALRYSGEVLSLGSNLAIC